MTNNNLLTKSEVATASSYGALANEQHAADAIKKAMQKMPADSSIGGVLLFLTNGYSHNPQPALSIAVKTAGTPQIFGCCAMGLMTEEEWLLDVEGAVAMVFPQEISLTPQQILSQQGISPNFLLTFSSPNAASIAVNSHTIPKIGAITTDEYGHGPYSIWQSGRIIEHEYSHLAVPNNLSCNSVVAESIRQVSPSMLVNLADGHSIIETNQKTALDSLREHLPENLHSLGFSQPYNLLCAISENSDVKSIEQGHFKLQHIVSIDEQEGRIHLSGSIKSGKHIFWAIRDEQHAQKIMMQKLTQCFDNISSEPKFALMFPNISRGAEFYNGQDEDWNLFKKKFPNIPMIGFYSNGEIAPGHKLAGLIHRYSTIVSVFS